jgi:hypothetical protein
MKAKLLKKVRKRFSIIHTPNGLISDNKYYNYNLFRLIDKEEYTFYPDTYCQLKHNVDGKQFCSNIFETEKECIGYLLSTILEKLRHEGYTNRKDKLIINKINNSKSKVWYNQK